jgi:hypothetical protein
MSPVDEPPRGTGGDAPRDAGEMPAGLPRPLEEFVALFNRGEYWESHEALEDAWRATGSDFYQGLILYASAFVHARRENAHGVVAQLEKAADRLEGYPSAYLGIDVEGIRRHARRCREIVEEGRDPEAGRDGDRWADRVPFPVLRPDPGLLRGDERELTAGDAGSEP